MTDRFDNCAALRQKILDHINAHPHSGIPTIRAIFKLDAETAYRNLAAMAEKGEVEKHGKGANTTFTALQKTTESAHSMRDRMHHAKAYARSNKVEEVVVDNVDIIVKRGHIRHLGTNRSRPIPAQGGQGGTQCAAFGSGMYSARW